MFERICAGLLATLIAGCGTDDLADGIDDPIPAGEYCAAAADWDPVLADLEEQVLIIVNQERSRGATCGGETMPAVTPLSMDGSLRCAARMHSLDMDTRGFFDHTNPDNQAPWDRMDIAGYRWSAAGENIATDDTAEGVMARWMDSPGHCMNIMSGDFVHIGVGKSATMWTQVFGSPR